MTPEQHLDVVSTRWEARFSSVAHCETSHGSHCSLPYFVPLQGDERKVIEALKLAEVHHSVIVLVGGGHQRLQKHPANLN